MFVLRKVILRSAAKKRLFSARQFSSTIGNNNNGFLSCSYPDVEIPNASVQDVVFSNADKWGNKIATECGITGRKYTYDDIRKKSRNLSRSFRKKLKLSRGDAVAALLPNIPEFPIVIFGTLTSDMTLTTINPLYTPEEISRQLIDSSAKVVVTLARFWKTAYQAVQMTKKQIPIVTVNEEQTESTPTGAINFRELVENECDIEDITSVDPNNLAFLPYSSGTTGLPKGVELTHHNIVSNLSQLGPSQYYFLNETSENSQDVLPCVLPMFHIYGLTVGTLFCMKKGCKLVTLPQFTPDSFISMLKNHKPTSLLVAPPLILFMTMHPEVTAETLQSVNFVMSGSAPLGALDEQRFLEKANKDMNILQGYGLTETSPVVTVVDLETKAKYPCNGTIGLPLPNTHIKVVPLDNPSGDHVGPNTQGELLVKGPQVMRGYHNKPDQNKEIFLDGWLRTGDVVYYNENKLLYVTDRVKELIKVKGFQVPPAELEEIVRSYEEVSDAAVIGIPHKLHGEVPRAYVVPKKGKSVNTQKLDEFVSSKVAQYKQLKGGIAIVDSIPKNNTGKILRRQLKLQYAAQGN